MSTRRIANFEVSAIGRAMPRFSPDHYAAKVRRLHARATGHAWLLQRGEHVIPIPGTTNVDHLLEDLGAAEVQLSAVVVARVEAMINEATVAGPRYNAQGTSVVDTEVF